MPEVNPKEVAILAMARSSWYVRKDNKFFPSDRLTTNLSKEDVERACLARFLETYPEVKLTQPLVKEVFSQAIVKRHRQLDQFYGKLFAINSPTLRFYINAHGNCVSKSVNRPLHVARTCICGQTQETQWSA